MFLYDIILKVLDTNKDRIVISILHSLLYLSVKSLLVELL